MEKNVFLSGIVAEISGFLTIPNKSYTTHAKEMTN